MHVNASLARSCCMHICTVGPSIKLVIMEVILIQKYSACVCAHIQTLCLCCMYQSLNQQEEIINKQWFTFINYVDLCKIDQ